MGLYMSKMIMENDMNASVEIKNIEGGTEVSIKY